jgi:hypothetical protein
MLLLLHCASSVDIIPSGTRLKHPWRHAPNLDAVQHPPLHGGRKNGARENGDALRFGSWWTRVESQTHRYVCLLLTCYMMSSRTVSLATKNFDLPHSGAFADSSIVELPRN